MKTKLFIILAILSFSTAIIAQTQEEQFLVVDLKNGTENKQTLSSVQKIAFGINSMHIILKNGQTTPIPISDIQKILFVKKNENVGTGILKSADNSISVYPNPAHDVLHIAGVDENTAIHIFNVNGALLRSVTAQEKGTELNVSALGNGMYILQAGNQAVKFIKR